MVRMRLDWTSQQFTFMSLNVFLEMGMGGHDGQQRERHSRHDRDFFWTMNEEVKQTRKFNRQRISLEVME